MILHNTYQPDIYYTSFTNLPSIIQDFIIKHCEELLTVENSKYTVFKDMAFIRHNAIIDGIDYDIELSLGELSVDEDYIDNIDDIDEVLKREAISLLEIIEFEALDAYLTVR